MGYWLVKDEYSNKVYLRTKSKSFAASFSNYYNDHKNLQTQNVKISFGSSWWPSNDYDINYFTGYSIGISFEHHHFKHPFAVKNFDKLHQIYRKKKFDLTRKLCRKHHLWPYYESDGHKLCGFDW